MAEYKIADTSKIHQIVGLVHLAELNTAACSALYDSKIDKTQPMKFSATRLFANNAFNSAVTILNALLLGSSKREICIKPMLEKTYQEKLPELEEIQEAFKNFGDENGVKIFKGSIEGTVAPEPRGEKGFGWDPMFIPKGYELTWGEMDTDQQKDTSMRRVALKKLQEYLESQ